MKRIKRCKDCDCWNIIMYGSEDGDNIPYAGCDQEGFWKPYSDRTAGSFACLDYESRAKIRRNRK